MLVFNKLAVKIVVVIFLEIALAAAAAAASLAADFSREAEIIAEASRLLKRLSEHLILADVVIGDRPTGELHRLLEMPLRDLRNRIVIDFHARVWFGLSFSLSLDIDGDAFSDGQLTSSLADLRQIGAGESVENLGQIVEVDFLVDGRLAEARLQDGQTRWLIGQRDVNQLIQTTGTQDGGIDDVRSVGSSDNKDVLLGPHTVHFCEDLIDDSIGSAASVSGTAASRLGDRVQLVEEQDAGSG